MEIREKIGKSLLFFDGAMGSMLQKKGLKTGELPELLNINNPEIIYDIHSQYLKNGADIITTNTFGAFDTKFDNLEEVIKSGVEIAKKAISDGGYEDKYVAFDLGSTGKLLKPLGELTFDECYELYKKSFVIGEKAGADIVILETMSDLYETKAAVLACKENTSLPIICTMTFEENGKNLTGANVATVVAVLEGLGVDALGINCGLGPVQIKELLKELLEYASIPVLVQPNAGLPKIENGETVYDFSPKEFGKYAAKFAKMGVWLLGGCCGTTPKHIREVRARCEKITPPPCKEKNITIVTSGSKHIIIGKKPIIIGERINPTGKKKMKEALKNNDMNYIINEALAQTECGADLLDVNVGTPEIDEKEMLLKAMETVQETVNVPLQLDSSTPEVLEYALRYYNGKAMINSVNGKEEIMHKVFPIVKKYGGVVVGLALDENGIPPTANGRLKIAEKIINTAESYGISRKNIVIDTLTLTVSAQQAEAMETLKALRLVRGKLGVNTVLGVSNISFGLPERSNINTAFLNLALYNGLSCCIINPMLKPMRDTINAYNVLANIDDGCAEYVKIYSQENEPTAQAFEKSETKTLKEIIIKGLKDSSYKITQELLESGIKPVEIIDGYIVPALDIVGKGYETGKVFLPQLMMSAEASKNAFNAIKEFLEKTGTEQTKKGKIVIATVKGDIHDIGKNIVKALLENYGFDVIDLGKDVEIKTIIDTVVNQDIKLLGLSALMTTTVVNMEKTIQEVKKVKPDCKIMVGGAVLTEEYAKEIGADFYGKDALSDVGYANEIFS